MKLYFFLLISISQQILYSYAIFDMTILSLLNHEPQCMTIIQTLQATKILCRQKGNIALWQKVIDCHKPISEEFLRSSGEAQCPVKKHVQDPTDTRYTIEEVFLNFCGLVESNFLQLLETGICNIFGKSNPNVTSQSEKLAVVKSVWGNDVPCNIGKCILDLNIK